jgi:CPA2 family monovalent cation:H+ antiporter-2
MAVLPEMEAGLEIARQALLHLEIPVTAIQQYTDAVRQELYAPLHQEDGSRQLLAMLGGIKNLLEISWFEIPLGSPLLGKSIAEAAVRSRTGASIVGIIHDGAFQSNPQISCVFQAGDLVAVVGSLQERNAFEQMTQVAKTSYGI